MNAETVLMVLLFTHETRVHEILLFSLRKRVIERP